MNSFLQDGNEDEIGDLNMWTAKRKKLCLTCFKL